MRTWRALGARGLAAAAAPRASAPPAEALAAWVRDGAADMRSGALVGRMSVGKTRALRGLLERFGGGGGGEDADGGPPAAALELVSFETTLDFVRSHGTESVGFVCGGINSARARSLVVRFGLINAWTKQVGSLSSGELRKLTLARAMANAPDLLLIDGAHDGLDPKSRYQLSGLLAGLARGLPKLLVQLGGSGHAAPKLRARLLQVSHRAEEFATEIEDVFSVAGAARPLVRSTIDTALPLSQRVADMERILADAHDADDEPGARRERTAGEAVRLVARGPDAPTWYAAQDEPIIDFDAATVTFAKPPGPNDRETPSAHQEHVGGIRDLRLQITSGQFWAFVGKNGAGKSSLVKLMASPRLLDQDLSLSEAALGETQTATKFSSNNERELRVLGEPRGAPEAPARISDGVGVVSMDGHMRTLFFAQHNPGAVLASDVIRSGRYGAAASGGASLAGLEAYLAEKTDPQSQVDVAPLCAFVGFPEEKLSQPFETLGLGEQRLALVARALIHKPRLLIFDEASQGLDAPTREDLKALLTELHADVPQLAIIVITHHGDEIPDGVTHMLHLEAGQAVSNGPVDSSDAVRAFLKTL